MLRVVLFGTSGSNERDDHTVSEYNLLLLSGVCSVLVYVSNLVNGDLFRSINLTLASGPLFMV